MDRENTSLFLQNLLIMEENERMRRQARQLDQENKALLAQLKQRSYQQQHLGGGGGPSASGSGTGGGGHSLSADAGNGNLKTKVVAGKQPK